MHIHRVGATLGAIIALATGFSVLTQSPAASPPPAAGTSADAPLLTDATLLPQVNVTNIALSPGSAAREIAEN